MLVSEAASGWLVLTQSIPLTIGASTALFTSQVIDFSTLETASAGAAATVIAQLGLLGTSMRGIRKDLKGLGESIKGDLKEFRTEARTAHDDIKDGVRNK